MGQQQARVEADSYIRPTKWGLSLYNMGDAPEEERLIGSADSDRLGFDRARQHLLDLANRLQCNVTEDPEEYAFYEGED